MNQTIKDFQSDGPPSNTRTPIIVGFLCLFFGFGGFIFWASTAPLDEGVPTIGVLSVESKRKTISHLTGGVVKEIRVTESQLVDAQSTLIILDDTLARANYESALQTYFAFKTAEARLSAEQVSAKYLEFPEVLTKSKHPLAKKCMDIQLNLFKSRRDALISDIAVFDELASASASQVQGFQEQLVFLKQQLDGIRDLTREGYAPRNQQLELERQQLDLLNNISKSQHSKMEALLRKLQRQKEFQKEVLSELADTRRDAANAYEKVNAAKLELDRSVIRSPVEGYVTGLAIHTISGTIAPGMKIMDIVPASEKLIFEVRVPTQLIDKVHTGLFADINLHNFPEAPRMVIEGKVTSISADILTDPNPNLPPYFLCLVEVTQKGMEKLGGNQLQPGMQADVMIKTGERTMLNYLLKPLLRKLNTSLKEV